MIPRYAISSAGLALSLLFACLQGCVGPDGSPPEPGEWHARLVSPGGDLPFRLTLEPTEDPAGEWRGWVGNGSETLEIPLVRWDGAIGQLYLEFPHFDADIVARADRNGTRLTGRWRRTTGVNSHAELVFLATHGAERRFSALPGEEPNATEFPHRWAVSFSSSEYPAVAELDRRPDGTVEGTILTTTGDYGHLAGSLDGDRLRLSTFNGAHAFLFDARLSDAPEGPELKGRFWSRDTWQEQWAAWPDPEAKISDPLQMSRWNQEVSLLDLEFRRLDGTTAALREVLPAGPAVLELFGTWCPNCNDSMPVMVELHERYAERGLKVVGIAFEVTGDVERDARQVVRFAEHHGVDFPILLGGTHKKADAAQAFQALDEIHAYPTTVFVREDGQAHAVHSGFSGPATGQAFDDTKQLFHSLVAEILEGTPPHQGEKR